jgi:hypothetical protein
VKILGGHADAFYFRHEIIDPAYPFSRQNFVDAAGSEHSFCRLESKKYDLWVFRKVAVGEYISTRKQTAYVLQRY